MGSNVHPAAILMNRMYRMYQSGALCEFTDNR